MRARHRGAAARRIARFALALAIVAAGSRAADVEQGRQIYARHCAQCHGERGVPVMPGTPNFTRLEGLMQPDPVIVNRIKAGRNAMPAFNGLLRDRELFDVVAYLRMLR